MKYFRHFFIFTLHVCLWFNHIPAAVYAQNIDPVYISISDGLVDTYVQDIIQDRYGLFWIATANGVQKWDGINFETYKKIPDDSSSLQNNNAWGIAEDHTGAIWVCSDLGVSRFNRSTRSFTNYDFAKQFKIPGQGGRVFRIHMDTKNRLWASTGSNQLLQYNRAEDIWQYPKFELNDPNEEVDHRGLSFGFTEDIDGGLWISSIRYGIMYRSSADSAFRPFQIDEVDFSDPINDISRLYADSTNVLWITTRVGVYKYYPDGTLKTIQTYNYRENYIWNYWNSIKPDNEGNIWIANNFRGILKFDGISDQFKKIRIDETFFLPGMGWDITLTKMLIDNSGIMWFGTQTRGLMKYDPEKKPFSLFTHSETNPNSISTNAVFALKASSVNPDLLYIGTRGGFLDIFNQKEQSFQQVTYTAKNDIYSGSVRSIGEDNDGTLWLGTWGDGLIELDKNYKEIKRFTNDSSLATSISDNLVRVIKKDKTGNYWIGTDNGLNYFKPDLGEFTRISSVGSRTYSLKLLNKVKEMASEAKQITEIGKVRDFQDRTETIEIETPGKYIIEMVGEGAEGIMVDFGWLENGLSDTVWTGFNLSKTFHAGGASKNRMQIDHLTLEPGIYKLRYISDDSHCYQNWNNTPPDQSDLYGIRLIELTDTSDASNISHLIEQDKGKQVISGLNITDIEITESHVWVGTNQNGLNKINLKTNAVTSYLNEPVNNNSISSNSIFDIYIDDSGTVWLTTDTGLNRMNPSTGQFTKFTTDDGLPTNLLESILQGNNDEMWISSRTGLTQMIRNEALDKVTFINYSAEDGLGGNSFLALAAAKMSDGKLYFGGDHGLNAIGKITTNNIPPALIFSDFLISNESVFDMGDESPLQNNLLDTDDLRLSYKQNNLSFEFVALHYANPQKNQYAHFLKGYDKDWVYDNRNYASYTNLDPGEYEFAIRASNTYGVWNEEGKSIKITILPPWWLTWWAYALYVLLFLLGLFTFNKWMRQRLLMKERERAREKELAQAREIEKAYSDLKATQAQLIQSEKMASLGELTAGIAHEIQNPLNFVNNFADVSGELLAELKEELEKGDVDEAKVISDDVIENLKKINHHGKRASFIVQGMLEHSRSNTGEKKPTDLNVLAEEFLKLSYQGLRAKDKSFNANFNLEADDNLPKVNVVTQDIGRVLLNLINNAFFSVYEKTKQSLDGYKPEVVVKTQKYAEKIEIRIKDNGTGIPDEIKDKIFQPFFTTKPTGEGTGLGLSMSYDIITKGHGGTLKMETTEGVGTEFIINLNTKYEK